MEWVDFEQQTPENKQRCVVFCEDGTYMVARYYKNEGKFYEAEGNEEILDPRAWTALESCPM